MATTQKVEDLIKSVSRAEFFLPEFQRGYVWTPEQVKKYFQSLYFGYPTGSFLIWKSEQPIKTRGCGTDNGAGFKLLILDGQQRLTTLYTMINGTPPPWFEGKSIRTDLYFNLSSQEFQYYQKILMDGKPEWINVALFLQKGMVEFVRQQFGADASKYLTEHLDKFAQLERIYKYEYYIQEINEQEPEKVVDIFNLVNSEGTRLSQTDLSLALVTSRWEQCKESIRNAKEKYGKISFFFDMDFFMRGIAVLGTSRGKFDDVRKLSKDDLVSAWNRLEKALDYLCNVMIQHACVDSTSFLSTLVPFHLMLYYIANNNFRFPDTRTRDKFLYWFYSSLLWGRYSGSHETTLERDIRTLSETNSVDELIKDLALTRGGKLEVSTEDLELQGIRSRFYQIVYTLIRSNGAADWTDSSLPLYHKGVGKTYSVERHHIFPKSKLYKIFDSNSSYEKNLVNEIANMAFLTSVANHQILNDDPANYLPKVDREQLTKQFVPLDPATWEMSKEGYLSFLKERRRLLAEAINHLLDTLYHGAPTIHVARDIGQWRDRVEEVEKAIRKSIVETFHVNEDDIDPKAFVPEHVAQKVKQRVNKHLMDNPSENRAEYDKIDNQVSFFDVSEYFDLIARNWNYFQPLFGHKPVLQSRFNQLQGIRNAIAHNRELNEVTIKDGEASVLWFSSALRRYMPDQGAI